MSYCLELREKRDGGYNRDHEYLLGKKINRVADQAKRRLVTTSEPAEDCYDLLLYVLYAFVLHFYVHAFTFGLSDRNT
ncbi:hypothetical protein Syun_017353 [Stephania yunnanensis]|uniref:Uncharacterized protein n=1 Tax=Stephania yunnanensis TaxID=152371 RepID=A0AAP0J6S9_9MAGN